MEHFLAAKGFALPSTFIEHAISFWSQFFNCFVYRFVCIHIESEITNFLKRTANVDQVVQCRFTTDVQKNLVFIFQQISIENASSYSSSVRFGDNVHLAINFSSILNLSLITFVPGQIVTVGNGINDIGESKLVKMIGLFFHLSHSLSIIEMDNQMDNAKAMIHHNLIWIG